MDPITTLRGLAAKAAPFPDVLQPDVGDGYFECPVCQGGSLWNTRHPSPGMRERAERASDAIATHIFHRTGHRMRTVDFADIILAAMGGGEAEGAARTCTNCDRSVNGDSNLCDRCACPSCGLLNPTKHMCSQPCQ